MTAFHDLELWKIGTELVKETYVITSKFPQEEKYGLTSQLRRAATSILANFAEGCGRFTYKDKAAKFVIARGECAEVHAFFLIAIELKFCDTNTIRETLRRIDRVSRMLSGFIQTCRAST